jgi:predicted nucleic acid-binding protein
MICIDANVLLEIIEKRSRARACERFLDIQEADKAISMLTLDLVFYFVEKDKLEWAPAKTFLDSFTWLPVTEGDGHWAFAHCENKDFEDGLQVACAVREKCGKFVTLDRGLAKKYANQLDIKLIR